MEYKIKLSKNGFIKNPNKYVTNIGRPTQYQNPYPTKPSAFSSEIFSHNESLTKYKYEQLPKINVSELVKELRENKEIILSCSCIEKTCSKTPKEITTCHGELLAEKVYKELDMELKKEQKITIGITGHANIEKHFYKQDNPSVPLTNDSPAFRGDLFYLSNMYPCRIKLSKELQEEYPYLLLNDDVFDSVERAYQYIKSNSPEYKNAIKNTTIKGTKIVARDYLETNKSVEYISEFHDKKLEIMELLVRLKFSQNPDLLQKLIETNKKLIQENNNWNDTYWGISENVGENNLGKILMIVREDLQRNNLFYDKEVYDTVYSNISKMINRILQNKNMKKSNLVLISGMARGVDEIFADYAIKNNLPLILSIPNSIQWHSTRGERKGGGRAQALNYDDILNYVRNRISNGDKESNIYEIKKDYKSPLSDEKYRFANFARNQHMIDMSSIFISYKNYNSSGTDHAINAAKKSKKYYGNVNGIDKLPNLLSPFKIQYNTDLFQHQTHILIHGCNCFNVMGAGIARIIKNDFSEAYKVDQKTIKGNRSKMGDFTYADVNPNNLPNKTKYVVNLYSQYTHWDKEDMFDIKSFEKGLHKIINFFLNKRTKNNIPIKFSLPAIGLGLANGKIEEIYEVLKECNNKYSDSNIMIDLCLHEKDRSLNRRFKELEKDPIPIIKRSKNEDPLPLFSL